MGRLGRRVARAARKGDKWVELSGDALTNPRACIEEALRDGHEHAAAMIMALVELGGGAYQSDLLAYLRGERK